MISRRKEFWKLKGPPARGENLGLARVLLVDDDPTTRLTLQTVLEASGYRVDSAASAAEAVGKMDEDQYELVLSDLQLESPEAGLKVLAHARMMAYSPAAALITSSLSDRHFNSFRSAQVLIAPEDVPELLTQVANLIAERTLRMLRFDMKHACV